MADLRNSGTIEEDSDAVLLFREAACAPVEHRPKPWEAQALDVLVEKNRHGATGRVTLDFCGVTSRVLEAAHSTQLSSVT